MQAQGQDSPQKLLRVSDQDGVFFNPVILFVLPSSHPLPRARLYPYFVYERLVYKL